MKKKLKVDLHTHTAEDPYEKINYGAIQLIERASQKGFDAISITNHNKVTYNRELANYAEKKEIVLIPGMEATFSKKHVLIINPDFKKNLSGKSLKDLRKIKNDRNLIIAPHPYFPRSRSLHSRLFSFIEYFDAIEFSHYFNHLINFNKKAIVTAHQYKKPLIATSDCHNIWQFGTSYSLVEAEKDCDSIIEAIKKGKIELHASPLSLATMFRIAMNSLLSHGFRIPIQIFISFLERKTPKKYTQ